MVHQEPNYWHKKTFAEAPLEIIDGDRGTNYPSQQELRASGECLFLNAGNVTEAGFDFANCTFISADRDAKLRKGKLTRGDVVLTTRGTVGNTAYYGSSVKFEHIRINSGMVILRSNSSELDPPYLYSFVRSAAFQEQVAALRTGSAQPQLPIRDIIKIKIPIPPLAEQRAIASIVSALDDKIELNRRMNVTLEAMARAIFQSWFVDFDPVRAKAEGRETGLPAEIAALFPDGFVESELGEIPEGWYHRPIGELCATNAWTLKSGDDLSEIEYIEISEVSLGDVNKTSTWVRGSEPSRARRRLQHGDTALSTVRPERQAYFLSLNPAPNLIASTGFAVFTPQLAPWTYVHIALTRPEVFQQLGHLADGGAYPAISPELIGARQVAWPSRSEIIEWYHRISGPMLERMQTNRGESRSLANLRDSLLPRLISGQLRVPEAENALGEANV